MAYFFVGVKLAEFDMGHGMALDINDARVLHFLGNFPCKIIGVYIEIIGDDKDCTFEIILF